MAYGLWEVQGSFVIPGTRDKGTFGPIRVSAATKQAASKSLAPLLQEKFGREAQTLDRRAYRFGDSFALMHLSFREVVV